MSQSPLRATTIGLAVGALCNRFHLRTVWRKSHIYVYAATLVGYDNIIRLYHEKSVCRRKSCREDALRLIFPRAPLTARDALA